MSTEQKGAPRALRSRLSQAKRERFLEVLGQTGNRSLAAEAIGVDGRLMDQRREFDPLLDKQWREAMEQAQRRLAGASGPLDCIGGAEPMVIRRGPGGKLRVVKAGPRRWSRPVEERFFGALAVSGNIAGAARFVGFSEGCIAQRRRKWPDFARRMEETLEDAELALEFRLASESGAWGGLDAKGEEGKRDSRVRGNDGQKGDGEGAKFDADFALRFLKWREEKRRGQGRRGRVAAPPRIEDVAEKIVRKVEAIKRHEAGE
jgi:hypothetical protein